MTPLEELKNLSEARSQARDSVSRINEEIVEEIKRARGEKVPMHEIASALGVSRQAVYDLLEDA